MALKAGSAAGPRDVARAAPSVVHLPASFTSAM